MFNQGEWHICVIRLDERVLDAGLSSVLPGRVIVREEK
jgi:hypothetical protein